MWNADAKRCEIVVVCFSCLACKNMAKGEPWETGTGLLCTSQQPWIWQLSQNHVSGHDPCRALLNDLHPAWKHARGWPLAHAVKSFVASETGHSWEIHMQTLPGWRLNGGHTPSLSPSSSRDCPKWNLSRLQLDFISTRSCLLNIAQWLGRLRFLGFANLQESQAFKNQRGSSAASGSFLFKT